MFVSVIQTTVRMWRGDGRRQSNHTFVDGNDFYGSPRTGVNESDSIIYRSAPNKSVGAGPASGHREMENSHGMPPQASSPKKSTF